MTKALDPFYNRKPVPGELHELEHSPGMRLDLVLTFQP
jgi:hypothetical protein